MSQCSTQLIEMILRLVGVDLRGDEPRMKL